MSCIHHKLNATCSGLPSQQKLKYLCKYLYTCNMYINEIKQFELKDQTFVVLRILKEHQTVLFSFYLYLITKHYSHLLPSCTLGQLAIKINSKAHSYLGKSLLYICMEILTILISVQISYFSILMKANVYCCAYVQLRITHQQHWRRK